MVALLFLAAKGYMSVVGYRVRSDGQEKVITLPPALTVFGTVVDAETREAIPKFRVITGWPRDLGPTTNIEWSNEDRFWMSFAGGEYRCSYDNPQTDFGSTNNPGYILRFDAEGYSPFVSRTIAPTEGAVRLDVTLQSCAERIITVVIPSGVPARLAEVALLWPGARATFDGRTFPLDRSPGMVRIITDRNGEFHLPEDGSLSRVVVIHESGFFDADAARTSGETNWTLHPWGSISGTWLAGDDPVSNREVVIQALDGVHD